RLHFHVLGGSEGGFAELDAHPQQRVLAAARAGGRAARGAATGGCGEEGLEDVGETESGTRATAGHAGGATHVVCATLVWVGEHETGTRATAGRAGGATQVVCATLVRVGEHVMCFGDVLELLRTLGAGDVRVVFAGQLAVGALDVFGAGVAGDAQRRVVIAHE